MRKFKAYMVQAPLQNKLQARAERIAKAKALIARGEEMLARERAGLFDLFDEMFGPDTYVIYECRKPLEHFRLARVIQQPRTIDVDGLRTDPRITPLQFALATKVVADLPTIDTMEKRRQIDSRAVAEHTFFGARPNLTFEPTGSRSEIKLQAGQGCVVEHQHPVHAVLQEA